MFGALGVVLQCLLHNNGEQSKVQKEARPSRNQAETPLEVASFRALVTLFPDLCAGGTGAAGV